MTAFAYATRRFATALALGAISWRQKIQFTALWSSDVIAGSPVRPLRTLRMPHNVHLGSVF
jgi:hypothetical protein